MNFILPVKEPHEVSAPYGKWYKYGPKPWHYTFHTGVDLINKNRLRDLVAPQDGTVSVEWSNAKGNVVRISYGDYETEMGHLATVAVRTGQSVKAGDKVGVYGSTGVYTSGPHLHWELRYKGKRVDPMQYLGKPFKQEDYMQDFWPSIEEAYWKILWRGITSAEREALKKSSQDKAAYDRQIDNMWKSEERRKALELAYKNEINRTGKDGYGKEWVDFQIARTTQMSRAIKDLVDRKKEIKDSYKK